MLGIGRTSPGGKESLVVLLLEVADQGIGSTGKQGSKDKTSLEGKRVKGLVSACCGQWEEEGWNGRHTLGAPSIWNPKCWSNGSVFAIFVK
jgi:hypothetical protein